MEPSPKLTKAVHQFLNVMENEMVNPDEKEDLYFDVIEIVNKYLDKERNWKPSQA